VEHLPFGFNHSLSSDGKLFLHMFNWLLFKFRMGTQVPQLLQFRTTLSWLNLTYSYKLVLIVLTFDICVAMVI